MRIEGTYTFTAPIERVFAALADPAALGRILPGCARVQQLGPAGEDGTAAFELRLRTSDDHAATVSFRPTSARRPTYLRAELRGYGPLGAMTGGGHFDLVAQEAHTVGAYVWDVDLPAMPTECAAAVAAAGNRFARAVCVRLGEDLYTATAAEPPAGVVDGHPAVRVVRVKTPRGQIVALRAVVPALPAGARVWTQRALWMGAGLALGVGAIAGAVAVLHRLVGEDE
jgi:uncharacterized protein